MPQTLLTDPIDVHSRLDDLGVTEQCLREAISAGLAVRSGCTDNHPTNFPGLAMWAEIVKRLRDVLLLDGWVKGEAKGLPLVVRGDGMVAIAVASGDDGTGSVDDAVVPSTRHPKGLATLEVVERNQLLPFDHIPELAQGGAPTSTWLLLHCRRDDEIICELSHPVSMENGFVNEWDERIVLTPIPIDPTCLPDVEAPPVDSDVVIRRRA
jgi:hypothetical protein